MINAKEVLDNVLVATQSTKDGLVTPSLPNSLNRGPSSTEIFEDLNDGHDDEYEDCECNDMDNPDWVISRLIALAFEPCLVLECVDTLMSASQTFDGDSSLMNECLLCLVNNHDKDTPRAIECKKKDIYESNMILICMLSPFTCRTN